MPWLRKIICHRPWLFRFPFWQRGHNNCCNRPCSRIHCLILSRLSVGWAECRTIIELTLLALLEGTSCNNISWPCTTQRNAHNTHSVIDWVKVLRSTRHKIGHFGDNPQANLLAHDGKTKPNTTKARIHQSKHVLQHKINTKKTKARFSRLLRHPAWKWRRPILVLALHKFVTYLLT